MKKTPKSKIICIVGPTATGKSDLAVRIAKKFDGEVISADSRQVYKGLDVGTGKITKKEMCGVPHHLLSIMHPSKKFSVAEYQKLATVAIENILKRKKVPIICGGTGFYIQAIVDGLILPEVKPNRELRIKYQELSAEKLYKILKKLDQERAKTIDKNNKVRLIRAIEIAKALGHIPKLENKAIYDCIQIGIKLPKIKLQEKIYNRLLKRLPKMIIETKKLHKEGLSWKRMNELGLEYRYLALLLQKKISKKYFIEKLNIEIWRYAKRQITWFKKDKRIKWFSPDEFGKITKKIKDFL